MSDVSHARRALLEPVRATSATPRFEAVAPPACTIPADGVKVVRAWYAHYNASDGAPSALYWHPDAVYETAREDPDFAIHRGIDAIARLFASWRETYPDLRVDLHEAKAHRDRVFAWVRFRGRGAASGIPIQMELAHVFTISDGKTIRLLEYSDRAEALEAAGLAT
jgi:uncharacterized protein